MGAYAVGGAGHGVVDPKPAPHGPDGSGAVPASPYGAPLPAAGAASHVEVVAPVIPLAVVSRVGWHAAEVATAPDAPEAPAPLKRSVGGLGDMAGASRALRLDIMPAELRGEAQGHAPGELAGHAALVTAQQGGERALSKEIERLAVTHGHVEADNPFAG